VKIKNLIFYFCIALNTQTFSLDDGYAFALQLVESNKQRMLETGVLTPSQLQDFNNRGDELKLLIEEFANGNSERIFEYQQATTNYINEYDRLAKLVDNLILTRPAQILSEGKHVEKE
jgi:hypothetical protein